MQKMAESLDNLVDLKIKVPLSDKTKNIHTNAWIYYEPAVEFGDKIDSIYGEMKSLCKQFRYTFYRKNYWYVKAVSVKYSDGTMELTLSPMPTPYKEEKLNNASSTGKGKVNKTSNNSNDIKLSPPNFLNKTDKKWAEDFVTKHTKGLTNELEIAKKIYNKFKDGYKYCGYSNLRYTSSKGNRKSAFNRGCGNCADGANILETLFLTAGLNARIKHPWNHYIIKLKINGKTYWCDNRSTKEWNTVWEGRTSDSEDNIIDGVRIRG